MLDTHAVARSLTDADFTPAQADAITNAVRLAAEHGDHVTIDQFKAGLADLRSDLREEIADVRSDLREEIAGVRTDVAKLETRLVRWLVAVVLGAAGVTVAAVAALLRFWLVAGVP